MKLKRFLLQSFLLLLTLFAKSIVAQEFTLQLKSEQKEEQQLLDKLQTELLFTDSTSIQQKIVELVDYLHNESYLKTQLDSLQWNNKTALAYISIGKAFYWKALSRGNSDPIVLHQELKKLKHFQGKAYKHKELLDLFEAILKLYENSGYPFAQVKLNEINLTENTINAALEVNKGPIVRIDSIVNKTSGKTSLQLIKQLLRLKQGEPYSEEKIKSFTADLANIDFLKEMRPAQFLFEENKNSLFLYIDENNANSFDGILGANTDPDGKLQLNGQVDLRLLNIFHRGEAIQLQWKSPGNGNQDLKIGFKYPHIFNTPLWLETSLELFKQDSTFLNINQYIGVKYYAAKNHYLGVKVGFESSTNLLKQSISQIEAYDKQWYSLLYGFQQLDYIAAPRRGYRYELETSFGQRNSSNIKQTQYLIRAASDFYIPLFKKTVLASKWSAQSIVSDNYLENELIRFGGLKSLRGFNEKELSASLLVLHQLEYRYMLEKNSYLFAFSDISYYENQALEEEIKGIPYAFGAGSVFKTKAGLFSISYALGKLPDTNFEFRNAKIHFGLINQF